MPRESNKRGGKSTIEAQEEPECTESEMKSYFESLSKKLDAMNSNQEKRHVEMCTRFEALERNTSQLASDLKSLEEKFKTLEGDLADVKVQVENKVDETQASELERKINDLQNRSRRNNVVFWNVPEGSENGMPMTQFIQGILSEHMKLEDAESIEIMRAHRSPTTRTIGASKPRPIHVYLLRYKDRQFILANAAKTLKDNPYKESNLYISDDVTKDVRDERKQLKEKHLNNLRQNEEVVFAYVPWTIPAIIVYKVKDQPALKVILK